MCTSYVYPTVRSMTSSYLISYRNGLLVVPLSAMTGLYGVVTEKNYELVARDANEAEQTVVQTESRPREGGRRV